LSPKGVDVPTNCRRSVPPAHHAAQPKAVSTGVCKRRFQRSHGTCAILIARAGSEAVSGDGA
jgi:hypothetical protein